MASIPLSHVLIHGHDVRYRRAPQPGAVRLESAQRETIVLVHGLAGSSRTWLPVMEPLSAHYDVIAPDLLGHGESAKPMGDYSLGAMASGLRDLLTILDVERVTVVGQSFGGGVAMQLAYQHPELVNRLVLVGSGGLGREVSWILRACTLPGAELLMPFIFPASSPTGATTSAGSSAAAASMPPCSTRCGGPTARWRVPRTEGRSFAPSVAWSSRADRR